MVKLPEPDTREIITRAPFVEEGVGEMVAHILHGDAHIDVEIKPFETEMYAQFDLLPKEARRLAADLVRIADVAQQAMWTPKLLANVRERYLPGATDAQIIEQLQRLADRDDGLELLEPGLLFPQDGYALTAEAHRELVDRIAAALSAAGVTLGELETVVGDLRKVHRTDVENAS
ncbi:hypothetical protein [Jiangella alkaliphila]|uniref:Uncharacterized protein n=1 Tax=Jiangella alkaliphila TaxID=419479 RepID=A0A1H2GF38_9ACTN|nr:hypothetical protein [Jiangella alkaliphila]SDU18205.1 hypothetical protein SAMN04488563_0463 [Jiangella alkaliphila]